MRSLRRSLTSCCALVAAVLLAPAPSADAAGSNGAAEASDNPVTLMTAPKGLVGRRKLFSGTVAKRDRGRRVTIERYDEISRQWSPITSATAERDRTFTARWKADRPGPARVRARVERRGARTAAAAPEVAITLYRGQKATWYGPGFYGNRTACGRRMSKTLLGVAHKKLRCGTPVEFFFRGRTITVPVVDRGPYANHASWDLTSAAAQRLGFSGSGTIGVLRR